VGNEAKPSQFKNYASWTPGPSVLVVRLLIKKSKDIEHYQKVMCLIWRKYHFWSFSDEGRCTKM
jgi:hypothetical protein